MGSKRAPEEFTLPIECTFASDATPEPSAAGYTYWIIRCPGDAQTVIQQSLIAQAWKFCTVDAGSRWYIKPGASPAVLSQLAKGTAVPESNDPGLAKLWQRHELSMIVCN